MRGKALGKPFSKRRCRITPAYAGKSQHGERDSGKSEDHPRLCGEKHNKFVIVFHMKGSPPPMRGKVSGELLDINQYVITPAYAGKSSRRPCNRLPRQDHPRLCGEKRLKVCEHRLSDGSPPPMRGKGTKTLFPWRLPGITPAYAGKSICGRRFSPDDGDHPRLCGEKSLLRCPAG